MKKILLIPIALLLLTARPALAIVWDFDDGTTQGWSSSGFTLDNPGSGGNPDGFAQLGDTSPGAPSSGLANAPLLGALSGYASISWDALLPSNWNILSGIRLVTLVISNNNGTYYSYMLDTALGQSELALADPGYWQHWEAPLVDSPAWECTGTCSVSFAQVLADNNAQIAFNLEVTTRAGRMFDPSIEAGIDNVNLIPVPAALWLFGSGLLGLVGIARRRQK